MKDKRTIINSSTEHRVSLSTDKRVAARSHLGKRAKSRPADRIATGMDFNDIAENIGSLHTSDQLEARIKLLAEVTADLQKELLAVQTAKEKAQAIVDAKDEKGALGQQVDALHRENNALQSELEGLKASSTSGSEAMAAVQPKPVVQPQAKTALKKKLPVPIHWLSGDEQFEVDLEKRMQNIRQATQLVRIELEKLVKSTEAND